MNEHQVPTVVVVPGDLHLTSGLAENVRTARWMIDEVNGLVCPDFVQFIGDNVQNATEDQFVLFNELRGTLKVPHHVLIGDHDIENDPRAEGFRRHVGEPYGAMSQNGVRWIRLDTQEERPVGLSPRQAAWFRREVDLAIARGESAVVFQHNYPYQIWEDFRGPGIDDWREVVQSRRIAAIVCGHTHYWQVANDGRNVTIATRSIGDPEGGLPGYALLYLQGNDLAATYRCVTDRGPIVLITHPRERLLAITPAHIVRGLDHVNVRVWSETEVLSVVARLDNGEWCDLNPVEDGLWHGPLRGDRLDKGEHHLEVVARSQGAEPVRQEVGFMVDPTGRYTPIPEVRPTVTRTAFC